MSILTCFLLFLILPYSASLTFNLSNIGPNDQVVTIKTDGAAYVSDEGIQVTPENPRDVENSIAGRATYIRQLHLWDKNSMELASFSTSFSFVIDSKRNTSYADGLTFFLAENNSAIYGGGAMGLPFDIATNVTLAPFVAVEFDTFMNEEWDPIDPSSYDPIGEHVGINVNNLSSISFQKWFSSITDGEECQALITYSSFSKILSVSFTGFEYDEPLDYTVDLRDVLPEWVIFGFTASTGTLFQKNNVRSWAFNSSILQVDESNTTPPPTNSKQPDPVMVKKGARGYMVGLIAGACGAVVALLALAAILYWRKSKNIGDEVQTNNEFEIGSDGPRRFSYQVLALSTGGFAKKEKLGQGGFGEVYRGFLEDSNMYVAVKKVSKNSNQGMKEFASEVTIIGRLRQRNLVKLIGWCHEKGELLLVYEYMEKGSLDLHLFKGKSLLPWDIRYKIACGLASALLYLHEEWEQCVLHRDIKSSNVMLDSNFNAKLGDFGLAKLVDHEKTSQQTTMLAGTLGYMAPDYLVSGKASKESDVFSFGIVALEIACGRKPIEEKLPKLVEWVWEVHGTGTLSEAVDPRLGSDYIEEEMKRLMMIGLWCAHPDPDFRPSMRQAIQALKYDASLPLLPSKMPVAYYASSTSSFSYGKSSSIQTQSSISASNSGF